MNIIIVAGGSDTGKTTTLKKLYDVFVIDDGAQKVEWRQHPNYIDICAYVKLEGKLICIFSMGDNASAIWDAFHEALSKGCDWFICANSLYIHPYALATKCEFGITLVKHEANDEDQKHIINVVHKILNHEDIFV